MGGRSRRGRRGRRGRSPARMFIRFMWWRSAFGQAAALAYAVKTHPLIAAFLVVLLTIWYQSGSGAVAMTATPAIWGGACLGWFILRTHRTGLTVAQSAAQLRRQDRVRRQWELACEEAGLKRAPHLYRWNVRSEGDTVVAKVNTSAAGLSQEPILHGLHKMAEVVGGGCRDARMKALGHSGLVEIRFAWGDPLARVITPNMIPAAPNGMAVFGVAESGSTVGFKILNARGECILLPTLITGRSGSGKSSTGWALLLGLIKDRIPVRVWVADPAGGVELAALERALRDEDRSETFQVVRYADNQADIKAMIKDFHAQMMTRSATAKAKQQVAHTPTVADPINLLIIDELLWCSELIKEGKDGPLGQCMTAGRKVAFTVLAFAQTAKVTDLGALRDLFLFRIVMRVMTREGVEAALGSGSGWADKAPAHRIPASARGVGFVVDAEGNDDEADDAIKFRSVFLEDAQRDAIARGEMPSGIEGFAREEADPKAFKHCLYRYYDARMELLYVGETNNWKRRHTEHMRRAPWRDQVVEDSEHIVRKWYHGPTAADAEKQAKAAETHAIDNEGPLFNSKENERNPLRVIRGGKRNVA